MHMKRLKITMMATGWLWLTSAASYSATVLYSEDFTGLGAHYNIQSGGTYNAPSSTGWDLYGTQGGGTLTEEKLWDYKAANAGGAIVNEAQTPIASNQLQLTFTVQLQKVQNANASDYLDAVLKGSFASTDLSGQITGFGLYHDRDGLGDNTLNMNSFTITIPEPSSLALIGLAGLYAFIRKR